MLLLPTTTSTAASLRRRLKQSLDGLRFPTVAAHHRQQISNHWHPLAHCTGHRGDLRPAGGTCIVAATVTVFTATTATELCVAARAAGRRSSCGTESPAWRSRHDGHRKSTVAAAILFGWCTLSASCSIRACNSERMAARFVVTSGDQQPRSAKMIAWASKHSTSTTRADSGICGAYTQKQVREHVCTTVVPERTAVVATVRAGAVSVSCVHVRLGEGAPIYIAPAVVSWAFCICSTVQHSSTVAHRNPLKPPLTHLCGGGATAGSTDVTGCQPRRTKALCCGVNGGRVLPCPRAIHVQSLSRIGGWGVSPVTSSLPPPVATNNRLRLQPCHP